VKRDANPDIERLFSALAGSEEAARRSKSLAFPPMPEDVVYLAYGDPCPKSYPYDLLAQATRDALEAHKHEILAYGTYRGYPPLLDFLVEYVKEAKGIEADVENLLITSGTMQGLDLLCRVFVSPGDTIVCEQPCFMGAVGIFQNWQSNLQGVGFDEQGVDMEHLERIVEQCRQAGRPVKMLYVVPNFQNPRGSRLSPARRTELLEAAARHGFMLIEDDPYGEILFAGEPLPAMKSVDEDGWCIYSGSFSKVLAPGLRMAYLVADPEVLSRIMLFKRYQDVSTSFLLQGLVEEYCRQGHLSARMAELQDIYRRKCEIMLKALDEYMPAEAEWQAPEGGFFIWLTLPEKVDTTAMLPKAIENGVAYVPGERFCADGSGGNCLRLAFSYVEEERINLGIERLARTIRQEL